MRVIVTGGCGFIGTNLVRSLVARHQVVTLDLLTYAATPDNLSDLPADRHRLVVGDVADAKQVQEAFDQCKRSFRGPVEAVFHLAAESHVDRSIENAQAFVRTNVLGTQAVLEVALKEGARVVMASTDEVYGSAASGEFVEADPLAPNSPYSASKAAADLLCRAYHRTFGLPVVVTRCTNNYGPYQYPEKLIPLAISLVAKGEPIPVYGDGTNVREWIWVGDHCAALEAVLDNFKAGEVYNVGGGSFARVRNIDLADWIVARVCGGARDGLVKFVKDRPGHDHRYAVNCSKLASHAGWTPKVDFGDGLGRTVEWYLANQEWVAKAKERGFADYQARHYGERDKWVDSVTGRK